ncbi:MAG: sulfotransferase family 2 domain-containing protein [Pseudomonadota bacterium]
MIISAGRGYIFVHIPKTGGTSLTLALEARAKADDIIVADTPKGQRRKQRLKALSPPRRLWKHSRLSDIDGMSGLPDPAFVFTLVRNPWDRVVSLYHWSRMQGFDHPMINAAKTLPFDAFLTDPAILSALKNDTAATYVTDRSGCVHCDAFVRLEHLATDLAPVEAHLGFKLDLPHVNASDHPHTPSQFTSATTNLIGDIFAADIARFGYTGPGGTCV